MCSRPFAAAAAAVAARPIGLVSSELAPHLPRQPNRPTARAGTAAEGYQLLPQLFSPVSISTNDYKQRP